MAAHHIGDRPIGETKRLKRQKTHCGQLAIRSDLPRRPIDIKFCLWPAIVLSFKYRENQLRVFGDPGVARKIAFPHYFDWSHINNSLYERASHDIRKGTHSSANLRQVSLSPKHCSDCLWSWTQNSYHYQYPAIAKIPLKIPGSASWSGSRPPKSDRLVTHPTPPHLQKNFVEICRHVLSVTLLIDKPTKAILAEVNISVTTERQSRRLWRKTSFQAISPLLIGFGQQSYCWILLRRTGWMR